MPQPLPEFDITHICVYREGVLVTFWGIRFRTHHFFVGVCIKHQMNQCLWRVGGPSISWGYCISQPLAIHAYKCSTYAALIFSDTAYSGTAFCNFSETFLMAHSHLAVQAFSLRSKESQMPGLSTEILAHYT